MPVYILNLASVTPTDWVIAAIVCIGLFFLVNSKTYKEIERKDNIARGRIADNTK